MDIFLTAVHDNGKHGVSYTSPRSGNDIIAWLPHVNHLFPVTQEDSRFFVGVCSGKQGLYRVSFLPAEEQLRVREILPCIYNNIYPSLRYRNILYLASEDGISWFNLHTLQCSCPVRSIAEIEDRFLLVRTSCCNQLVSSSTGESVYSFSDDWGIRYECVSDTGTVYRMVKFPDGTCEDCLEKLLYIDRSDHVVRETDPVQSLVLTIESWTFGSSLTCSFADTYKKGGNSKNFSNLYCGGGFMTDQVGLFFYIHGNFCLHRCSTDQAEQFGDFLCYPKSHYKIWEQFYAERYGVDFDYFPRGRIVYRKPDDTWIIYYDPCIPHIEDLKDYFTSGNVIFEWDEHYQCSRCNPFYVV